MKTTVKVNSVFSNGNKQMFLLENQSYYSLDLDLTKEYRIEINEVKSKRNLEQNKKLWAIIRAISKFNNEDMFKTYCDILQKADAKSDFVITAREMGDHLRKSFRGVKFLRKQEVNNLDCYVYQVYLGSSTMNTKECAELIEYAINAAYDIGAPIQEVINDYRT